MKNILEYLENTPHPAKAAFANEKTSLTFEQMQTQAKAAGSFLAKRGIYRIYNWDAAPSGMFE